MFVIVNISCIHLKTKHPDPDPCGGLLVSAACVKCSMSSACSPEPMENQTVKVANIRHLTKCRQRDARRDQLRRSPQRARRHFGHVYGTPSGAAHIRDVGSEGQRRSGSRWSSTTCSPPLVPPHIPAATSCRHLN